LPMPVIAPDPGNGLLQRSAAMYGSAPFILRSCAACGWGWQR
jgi:hypothetical protein